MLGKIINQRGKYRRIRLTDSDVAQAQEGLRGENLELLSECLQDSQLAMVEHKEMLGLKDLPDTAKTVILVELAKALFDKRATQSFTRYKEKLEQKVFDIKNGNE